MEADLERGERAPSGVDDVIPNATNDEGHGTERILASPTDLVETADRNVFIEESSSTWLPVPDSIVKATTTAVESVQSSSSSSSSKQVHQDNADNDFLRNRCGTPPYIPPTAYGFSEPIGSMYFLMALLIFRHSKTVSCWGLG